MQSSAEVAEAGFRTEAISAWRAPRQALLTIGLALVLAFALVDWLSAMTTRLYLDEDADGQRQQGTVWQHFGVRAQEVVPEIVSRDEAHFAFPILLHHPALLRFTAKPDGSSGYEIYLIDQRGRHLLATEKITKSSDRWLRLPTGKSELEFIIHGRIAWFDLRLIRAAFFAWPIYATVIAALVFAIWRQHSVNDSVANWATFAVSSIVCLWITEGALRFFALKLPPNILEARRDLGLVAPDPRWMASTRYKQRFRPHLKTNCQWEYGDIVRIGAISRDVSDGSRYRYPFQTDAEGFRNPTVRAKIDIAAIGDSFTDAMTSPVEESWPAVLEKMTGKTVQNYGTSAFGPQQELYALQDFAIKHQPKVVVLGFFAGNDLYDAERFERWQRAGELPGEEVTGWRLQRSFRRYETFYLWTIAQVASESIARPFRHKQNSVVHIPEKPAPQFDRGMFELSAGAHRLRFAFMPPYMQKLAVSRAELEHERGWELARETFLQMKATCEQNGSRLVVMFIPSKSAVYWPLLEKSLPVDQLQRAIDFYCRYNRMPLRVEQIRMNRLGYNELLSKFCEAETIPFLDLTSSLQAEVEAGKNVYFADDAHWNFAGHQVAARQLANFLSGFL